MDGTPSSIGTESGPFQDGLARRAIVVQECLGCQRRRLPRLPACPYCARTEAVDVAAEGGGVVYSWVRVHRPLGEAPTVASGEVPYVVAAVDLDGGARVFARLEPAAAAAVGLAVVPKFVEHDGWTELRFRPAS
ncbi:MAG TPA: OB-fold domain-containing protein [Acidimicrobiales bacterium]|nr:OB-fold domain-containing protein [Acidimicrobiales bacterium]